MSPSRPTCGSAKAGAARSACGICLPGYHERAPELPLDLGVVLVVPTVEGKVVEKRTGDPLGQVLVILQEATAAIAPASRHTYSDADGFFRFVGIPPGEYLLRFQWQHESKQVASGTLEGVTVESDTVRVLFELEVRGLVHGCVLDAQTSSPIQGAAVEITPETGGQRSSPTDAGGNYAPVKVVVKPRGNGRRAVPASVHLWGARGWNMGFSLENVEGDGSLSQTFPKWDLPGRFVIDEVLLEDDAGRSKRIGTNVVFEVFPKQQVLTPDAPLFRIPRQRPSTA